MEILKFDSFYELIEQLEEDKIFAFDDNHNKYIAIKNNNEVLVGIAYCDFGISEDVYYDESNNLLYVGVGKNIICIDVLNGKSILNSSLNSVFYNFLSPNEDSKVIIVCELDVYCYTSSKMVWKIGFRDMVADAIITERNVLKVVFEDDSELCIDINEGKYIL